MRPTNDLNVIDTQPLRTPDGLKADLPISPGAADLVYRTREEIRAILRGRDSRLLVVVGPCSVHDPAAAIEYAGAPAGPAAPPRGRAPASSCACTSRSRGRPSAGKGSSTTRTSTGATTSAPGCGSRASSSRAWPTRGCRPRPRSSTRSSRSTSPTSCRWAAIGARTTESQTHREMASGLSMPVGYKNGTDGGSRPRFTRSSAASRPHISWASTARAGWRSSARRGNPDGHVVLRGGNAGPNYAAEHVATAAAALAKAGVRPRMLVDCSHDNSGKIQLRQPPWSKRSGRQVASKARRTSRRHDREPPRRRPAGSEAGAAAHLYGQSITDACVDWATTERTLAQLALAQRTGRKRPALLAAAL